jgi:hypothetical protein
LARRTAEGKTGREAMRALKRHLTRVIYRILIRQTPTRIADGNHGVPRTT